MASSRLSSVSLVLAGVLLLLSAGAHAGLGWPAMRQELMKVSAPPDLMASMSIGWYLGSVAIAAFGAIALSAGLGAVTAGGRVFLASLIVGLAYGGFGLATYAIYREPHFLGFVVIGLLAAGGSIRALARRGPT
jgi:NO-binding membrane sensor protein with MHYT domain